MCSNSATLSCLEQRSTYATLRILVDRQHIHCSHWHRGSCKEWLAITKTRTLPWQATKSLCGRHTRKSMYCLRRVYSKIQPAASLAEGRRLACKQKRLSFQASSKQGRNPRPHSGIILSQCPGQAKGSFAESSNSRRTKTCHHSWNPPSEA